MAPPTGLTPADLPPDVNHVPYALAVHSVLTAFTLVVVAFRSVSRINSTGLKADDYCMLFAMACVIVNFGFMISTFHLIGRHVVFLNVDEIIRAMQSLVIGEFVLLLGLCMTKVSAIIFLLNMAGLKRWLRWTLYANMLVICVSTLVFIVIVWTQCKPVQANWDPRITDAKCISIQYLMNATYSVTAITVLTDFLTVLLPLPIIWNLKLDRNTKVSLTVLLGLGLFAAACAIVRMSMIPSLKHSREDPTWHLLPLGIWTLIELHVAMIVASLPPCRALALQLYRRALGKSPTTTMGGYPSLPGGEKSAMQRSQRSRKSHLNTVTQFDDDEGWIRMDHMEDGRSETSVSKLPLHEGQIWRSVGVKVQSSDSNPRV